MLAPNLEIRDIHWAIVANGEISHHDGTEPAFLPGEVNQLGFSGRELLWEAHGQLFCRCVRRAGKLGGVLIVRILPHYHPNDCISSLQLIHAVADIAVG